MPHAPHRAGCRAYRQFAAAPSPVRASDGGDRSADAMPGVSSGSTGAAPAPSIAGGSGGGSGVTTDRPSGPIAGTALKPTPGDTAGAAGPAPAVVAEGAAAEPTPPLLRPASSRPRALAAVVFGCEPPLPEPIWAATPEVPAAAPGRAASEPAPAMGAGAAGKPKPVGPAAGGGGLLSGATDATEATEATEGTEGTDGRRGAATDATDCGCGRRGAAAADDGPSRGSERPGCIKRPDPDAGSSGADAAAGGGW